MPAEQLAILVLKGDDAVMLLLAFDVTNDLWHHGLGDRKASISGLPMKLAKQSPALLNPAGGNALHFLDEVSNAEGARQGREKMDMIRYTADLNGQTIQRLGTATEVGMNLCTKGGVLESGLTIFAGEDGVDNDTGERLRHGSFRADRGMDATPLGLIDEKHAGLFGPPGFYEPWAQFRKAVGLDGKTQPA